MFKEYCIQFARGVMASTCSTTKKNAQIKISKLPSWMKQEHVITLLGRYGYMTLCDVESDTAWIRYEVTAAAEAVYDMMTKNQYKILIGTRVDWMDNCANTRMTKTPNEAGRSNAIVLKSRRCRTRSRSNDKREKSEASSKAQLYDNREPLRRCTRQLRYVRKSDYRHRDEAHRRMFCLAINDYPQDMTTYEVQNLIECNMKCELLSFDEASAGHGAKRTMYLYYRRRRVLEEIRSFISGLSLEGYTTRLSTENVMEVQASDRKRE